MAAPEWSTELLRAIQRLKGKLDELGRPVMTDDGRVRAQAGESTQADMATKRHKETQK